MSEEKNNKSSFIDLPDLPPSIDNAIQNLTDAPTRSIGTTFSDIWDLVFGHISYLSEKQRIKYSAKLERYKIELESAINDIPADKKIEPSVQITAQALENSKYCVEEKELRQMFTTLISNSMNIDYLGDIHPSFAGILKQMSPLDAIILKDFKLSPIGGFPLCNYQMCISESQKYYQVLQPNVCLDLSSDKYSLYAPSLSVLEGFGLIYKTFERTLSDDSLYQRFWANPIYDQLQNRYPEHRISIRKGCVFLSSLGCAFVCSCIPD